MSTTLIVVASATPSALLGALVVLMPALRMRSRAAIELVAADAAVTKAEELLTEYDRNRNKPWYWPTDESMAIEAAPEPEPADENAVDAEVLHVEHATGELYTFGPNHPGWVDLAEEVGLAQALSDRPAEDEDVWGDEQPGEALADAPASLRARFRGWRREQWSRIRVLCQIRRAVNEPYRGRHWVSDVQHTGQFPVINAAIPAQRTESE